ncbi:MAG: WD40 repeat domain-containing protein, partial [Cyanobacteria bacterium P01_A01_bin.83]
DILYNKQNIKQCNELNELLNCKLIKEFNGKYKVKNIFYARRFNKYWIEYKIFILTLSQKLLNINGQPYFIIFISLVMTLIFSFMGLSHYSFSLFDNAKSESEEILTKLERKEFVNHKDLYSLDESASQLKRGLRFKLIAENNLQEYPTVKPIHALGDVLDNKNIYKREIDQYQHPIRDISINLKGTSIAVGGEDENVWIYDIENKSLMAKKSQLSADKQQYHKDNWKTVTSLAFYPIQEQALIAVAFKNIPRKIEIYDDNFTRVGYLATDDGEISNINFSQDGKHLFYLQTTESSKQGRLFKINEDGKGLSLASDNLLNNIQNGNQITDVSFSQDNKYISTVTDKKICIRNLDLSLSIHQCLPSINNAVKVQFTPWSYLGKYSFLTMEKRRQKIILKLWNFLDDKISYVNLRQIAEFGEPDVQNFSFHPDKKYLVTVQKRGQGKLNRVTLWNLSALESSNNKFNLVSKNKNDIKTERILLEKVKDKTEGLIILNQDLSYSVKKMESDSFQTKTFKDKYGLPDNIRDLSIIPDFEIPLNNEVAIIDQQGNVKICDTDDGCKVIPKFPKIDYSVFSKTKIFKINYNKKYLLVLADSNLKKAKGHLYNLVDKNYIPLGDNIEDADISPDGDNIVVLKSGEATLRHWSETNELETIEELGTGIKSFIFSPKGNYLAVNTNDGIQLRTKEENFKNTVHDILVPESENTINFAFSNDDKYLAIIQDNDNRSVKIKKLSESNNKWIELRTKEDLDTDVSLIFNPYKVTSGNKVKANLFTTIEQRNIIRLWNIKEQQIRAVRTFYTNNKIINDGIKFSTNGPYLIAIEENSKGQLVVQYWDLDKKLNLQKLTIRLNKILTDKN